MTRVDEFVRANNPQYVMVGTHESSYFTIAMHLIPHTSGLCLEFDFYA